MENNTTNQISSSEGPRAFLPPGVPASALEQAVATNRRLLGLPPQDAAQPLIDREAEARAAERQRIDAERTPARAYARIELITPAAGRDVPADSWTAYQLGVREAAGPFIDEIARIAYNHGLHDGAAEARQRIYHELIDGDPGRLERALRSDLDDEEAAGAALVVAGLLSVDEQPRGVRYYVLIADELARAYDPERWPACLRLVEQQQPSEWRTHWWLVEDTEAAPDLEGKRVELTVMRGRTSEDDTDTRTRIIERKVIA